MLATFSVSAAWNLVLLQIFYQLEANLFNSLILSATVGKNIKNLVSWLLGHFPPFLWLTRVSHIKIKIIVTPGSQSAPCAPCRAFCQREGLVPTATSSEGAKWLSHTHDIRRRPRELTWCPPCPPTYSATTLLICPIPKVEMNLQSNVEHAQKLYSKIEVQLESRILIKIIRGCEVCKVAKFSCAIHICKISGLLAGATEVSKHEQVIVLSEPLAVLPCVVRKQLHARPSLFLLSFYNP